jgi:hypothetical protein
VVRRIGSTAVSLYVDDDIQPGQAPIKLIDAYSQIAQHLPRFDRLGNRKPWNKTTVARRLLSRKSATIFGQWTIPEPSTSHIGKGVAKVAQAAAFVYI